MNRRAWGMLVVFALAASVSCGRSSPEKTIQIALVTKALDSEWWQRVKSGAEEAARATPGVKLAVLAPEREINIDQQASILEDQITKKVSALAVAPAGVSEILPLLDKAQSGGHSRDHFRYGRRLELQAQLRRVRQSGGRPAGRRRTSSRFWAARERWRSSAAYWASARTMNASRVFGKPSLPPRRSHVLRCSLPIASAEWA